VEKRKNQNSILFVATLGVYLGLVLAGATPQVMAGQRAAMTRNFDISDEIEFKDDLDNKPDDDRSSLNDSVGVYLQDVEQLIAALGSLNRKRLFDTASSPFEVAQTVILPCEPHDQAGSYTGQTFENTNQAIRPYLERFSKQLIYGYSLGDCRKDNPAYPGKEAVASRSLFKLDVNAFSVEICVKKSSPLSASTLLAALPSTFQLFRTDNSSLVRQQLIDSTSFSKGSDQVFIVTRLPRASIDSLIALYAK
jgi:hypothetical protein